ncbi:MAG TPA: mechanosensitive ion channel domain-containing protein [Chitinophaga sp.]|nr:mechanosensitive ion channel domain-containing protein [Chitinophaga sp.]
MSAPICEKHGKQLLWLLLLLLPLAGLQAQNRKKAVRHQQDSTLADSARIRRQVMLHASDTTLSRISDTAVAIIINRLEGYTLMLNELGSTLKRGYDSTRISQKLPLIDSSLHVIKNNIAALGSTPNVHDLYTNKVMLVQLKRILKIWQDDLFQHYAKLVNISDTLQQVRKDTAMRAVPTEDELRTFYISQLTSLILKFRQIDKANKQALLQMGLLQNEVAMRYIAVTNLLGDMEFQLDNFSRRMFVKDYTYLWQPKKQVSEPSFLTVLGNSVRKNIKVLVIFFSVQWPVLVIWLLLAALFAFWTYNNTRKIRLHHPPSEAEAILQHSRLLYRFPVAGTLIFVCTLSGLLSVQYPVLFIQLNWVVTIAALSYMIGHAIPRHLLQHWLALVALLFIYFLNNLTIQATNAEQWGLFLAAIICIMLGVRLRKITRHSTLALPKHSRKMLLIFIVMSVFSLLLVISGRVTAAKIIGATAAISITMAVNLLYFVDLIMEAVYLQVEANKSSSTFISFIDFQNIQSRLKAFLYLFATIAWLMLIARNLYVFDNIYEAITDFLAAGRTIGNTTFTFGSVIIFLLVLWVSTVFTQLIAYMFGETGQGAHTGQKKKLGSAILLIRLAILGAGVLLAFAASGIPMDKLAIVIGALGVGIGFGLQNIVNNLVSGVILAFEKPIEVGDVIELGTRSGVVKEIGIRSSKISAYDGSEVIVPNGDLISQQLINWTLSSRTRRVELIIGVAYGSDVKQVTDILKQALQGRQGIMEAPEPVVFLYQFADSSINFRIFFWITDLALAGQLQSDILASIYENLQKAGIEMPFPQRDLHIKTVDPSILQQWKPGKPPEDTPRQ